MSFSSPHCAHPSIRVGAWYRIVEVSRVLVGATLGSLAALFGLGFAWAHTSDRLDAIEIRLGGLEQRIDREAADVNRNRDEISRSIEQIQRDQATTARDLGWLRFNSEHAGSSERGQPSEGGQLGESR